MTAEEGSSPRVRGKLRGFAALVARAELIPACAGKTARVGCRAASWGAHPRVCGENRSAPLDNAPSTGSSPRVRGKRDAAFAGWGSPRLIPACAGKTPASTTRPAEESAHPRVCGENQTGVLNAAKQAGSSPHVRGKPGNGVGEGATVGLIPACAGKIPRAAPMFANAPAHPRVCGENLTPVIEALVPVGSSPRVRGKRSRTGQSSRRPGLIPACAGKTGREPGVRVASWAHPRVCGENSQDFDHTHTQTGSSPRVRGKHPHPADQPNRWRLIPACAGKTGRPGRGGCAARAHPRVCRENQMPVLRALRPGGSSPRVRGKRGHPPGHRVGAGLIPACAGKTPSAKATCPTRTAHPRACGENLPRPRRPCRGPGSSPRVRGKREPGLGGDVVGRLIPARAGKTRPNCSTISTRRAHPRACGENAEGKTLTSDDVGSSPRVRGKLQHALVLVRERRLIPARAGKTTPGSGGSSRPGAHPRACGENPIRPPGGRLSAGGRLSDGSSPRVRGKRPWWW